jgi:hypothetical protein
VPVASSGSTPFGSLIDNKVLPLACNTTAGKKREKDRPLSFSCEYSIIYITGGVDT